MIHFRESGNIFDSGAQIIVNPVNCQGIMGAGLALAFWNRFPEIRAAYRNACYNRFLVPGKIQLLLREEIPHVLNFPTKDKV